MNELKQNTKTLFGGECLHEKAQLSTVENVNGRKIYGIITDRVFKDVDWVDRTEYRKTIYL